MTITQFRDEDYDAPRRMIAGRDACDLHWQMIGYAAKHLTDGVIEQAMVPIIAALAFIDGRAARQRALGRMLDPKVMYLHGPGESCPEETQDVPADKRKCPASIVPAEPGTFVIHNFWNWGERAGVVKTRREHNTRKKNLLGDDFLVAQLIARDGYHCRYCGRVVQKKPEKDTRSRNKLTIDHIDPNGGNDIENLAIACLACNVRKNGRTLEESGMALLPCPRIARLGLLDVAGDESWSTPAPDESHDERARDHSTDQTTDHAQCMVRGLENQAQTTPPTTQNGPETSDSSRTRALRARDARDSGMTRTEAWSGQGQDVVGGLVGGPGGAGPGGGPPLPPHGSAPPGEAPAVVDRDLNEEGT